MHEHPPAKVERRIAWMRFAMGLVGVAMFLGFGAITIDAALELRSYPRAPVPMTVAAAARLAHPGRGAWVRLSDLRLPCAWASATAPTSPYIYRLATGPGGSERIVIAHDGDLSCSDQPTSLVGVLSAGRPGRIVDLAFPDAPWATWPTPYQITLWTHRGPGDPRKGLIFMPPLTLLGLLVAIGYFRTATGARRAGLVSVVGVAGSTILPTRRLALSGAHVRSAWFGIGFLAVAGLLMISLPSALLVADDPAAGPAPTGTSSWVGRCLLMGPLFAIGAFLFWAAFGLWRARRRDARLDGALSEHVVPLLAEENLSAEGSDVGNRRYSYRHPTTGELCEYVAAPADRPLVTAGHLLVVHATGDPRHLLVVREGFEPFVLTDEERARAASALRFRVDKGSTLSAPR